MAQARAGRVRKGAVDNARRLANKNGQPRDMADAPEGRRWNTLGSQLEDAIRQQRGNVPPAQYRQAIEQYFQQIAAGIDKAETPPATSDETKPAAESEK